MSRVYARAHGFFGEHLPTLASGLEPLHELNLLFAQVLVHEGHEEVSRAVGRAAIEEDVETGQRLSIVFRGPDFADAARAFFRASEFGAILPEPHCAKGLTQCQ